jgi:phosphoglycerate dehydrogenase-like enzyme
MNPPLGVLVASDEGVAALRGHPRLRALRYDPNHEPTAVQRECEVLVHSRFAAELAIAFARKLPRLRLVQTLSSGYDSWVGRLPPGVALVNARGAHGATVAEWVVAVLLSHYRGLAAFARAQASARWQRQTGESLAGKRICVVGAGDLGRNIARLLAPFGCAVTLVGRTARANVRGREELPDLVARQDVVVLAVPLDAQTHHLAGEALLARLPDGAILVNVGRGSLVDLDALLVHTRVGRLTAILDVTDPEPLPEDSPLWTEPGVTITPHIAGMTTDVYQRGWAIAVAQLDAYARGESPPNLVMTG